MTMLLAVLWSVPLGIMSAVRQDTWSDYVMRLVSISGLSIPAFFVGVLLLFFLVRFFQWMPPLEFRLSGIPRSVKIMYCQLVMSTCQCCNLLRDEFSGAPDL